MLNKSFLTGAFTALFLIAVCGCASDSAKNEKPLWASDETLELVYPNSVYIARIGRGTSAQSAASFAESELSSYFSHSVRSEVKASEVMTDTKRGDKENNPGESQVKRSIERKVTVDSMNELFDVHLTSAWFDKKQKQYISCAYIKRDDAFNLYEANVRNARNKFRTFYDKASAEEDLLNKIKLLSDCEVPGEEYLETLKISNLLNPEKVSAYANDRKVVEGLELEKNMYRQKCQMYIRATTEEGKKLKSSIAQIIKNKGFNVTENQKEAFYEVVIDLDLGKNVYGETFTAEPEITVSIKTFNSSERFSYKRSLPKQTGFTAAEALVIRKVIASAEAEIGASLDGEMEL